MADHLRNLAKDTELELLRIRDGLPVRRRRNKTRTMLNSRQATEAKQKLENGLLTPMEYLRAVSHSADSLIQMHLDMLMVGDEEEFQVISV